MKKPRAAVSWSGGKDCCLAMHRARESFEIAGIMTMLTEDGSRTRSHGLRPELLRRQAEVLGLPMLTAKASWADYEQQFKQLLADAARWNISHVIFGDVFPDAHRQWAEKMSRQAGLMAVEPLWGEPTRALALEFLEAGGAATIVTVREDRLARDWLGQPLTVDALNKFGDMGIDPGGEHGEFHTVATAFPGVESTIRLTARGILSHGGCALLDADVDA